MKTWTSDSMAQSQLGLHKVGKFTTFNKTVWQVYLSSSWSQISFTKEYLTSFIDFCATLYSLSIRSSLSFLQNKKIIDLTFCERIHEFMLCTSGSKICVIYAGVAGSQVPSSPLPQTQKCVVGTNLSWKNLLRNGFSKYPTFRTFKPVCRQYFKLPTI